MCLCFQTSQEMTEVCFIIGEIVAIGFLTISLFRYLGWFAIHSYK